MEKFIPTEEFGNKTKSAESVRPEIIQMLEGFTRQCLRGRTVFCLLDIENQEV